MPRALLLAAATAAAARRAGAGPMRLVPAANNVCGYGWTAGVRSICVATPRFAPFATNGATAAPPSATGAPGGPGAPAAAPTKPRGSRWMKPGSNSSGSGGGGAAADGPAPRPRQQAPQQHMDPAKALSLVEAAASGKATDITAPQVAVALANVEHVARHQLVKLYDGLCAAGFGGDEQVARQVLNHCRHTRDLTLARRVLDTVTGAVSGAKPKLVDEKVYGGYIRAVGATGKVKMAFGVLDELIQAGGWPTIFLFNDLMYACIAARDLEAAVDVYSALGDFDMEPHESTHKLLLRAFWIGDSIDGIRKFADLVRQAPELRTAPVYVSLCKQSLRYQALDDFRSLLSEMMDAGFATADSLEQIMASVSAMLDWAEGQPPPQLLSAGAVAALETHYAANVCPTDTTCSVFLDIIRKLDQPIKARLVRQLAVDFRFTWSEPVYAAALDAFVSALALPDAVVLAVEMRSKDMTPNPATIQRLAAELATPEGQSTCTGLDPLKQLADAGIDVHAS